MKLLALIVISACAISAQETVTLSNTITRTAPYRAGIAMGTSTSYDSGLYSKNLIIQNPGMEPGFKRTSVNCVTATSTTCNGDNQFDTIPAHFYQTNPGTYRFSAYCTSPCAAGNITDNTAHGGGVGPTYTLSCTSNCANIPGSGVRSYMSVQSSVIFNAANVPPNGWQLQFGNGTLGSESSDIRSGSLGVQAMQCDGTSVSNGFCAANDVDDTKPNGPFLLLNGTYSYTYWAKYSGTTSTTTTIQPFVQRQASGGYQSSCPTITLTTTWTQYTCSNITPAEIASQAAGNVLIGFNMQARSNKIYVDEASLLQTDGASTNTTAYRDTVVNALKVLNPGTLRYWDSQMGETLDNWITPQLGRMLTDWAQGASPYFGTITQPQQGLYEFLELCAFLGADPYVAIPPTWTQAEYQNLMEFLGGSSGTTYGAKRAALGRTAAYTTIFKKIYLTITDEPWNASFGGENFDNYSSPNVGGQAKDLATFLHWAYPIMRSTSYYTSQPTKFDMVAAIQTSANNNGSVSFILDQLALNMSASDADSVETSGYLGTNLANISTPTAEWNPEFINPWLDEHDTSNVCVTLSIICGATIANENVLAGRTNGQQNWKIHVYEFSTGDENNCCGAITLANLQSHDGGGGLGLMNARQILNRMKDAKGADVQNAWQFSQENHSIGTPNGNIPIWGFAKYLAGGSKSWQRPSFYTMSMLNNTVGTGSVATSTVTGGGFNFTSAAGMPSVTGVPYIDVINTVNGTTHSIGILNMDTVASHSITWAGVVPTGTATQVLFQPATLNTTNETAANTVPVTSTVTFGSTYVIPAHSLATLTFTTGSSVSVPNIVNQTQAAATTAITTGGMVVGTIMSAPSNTIASGSVISQSPAAGTSVASGSSVSMVVSTGPSGTVPVTTSGKATCQCVFQ